MATLMVQGCSSWAGKSWVVTALASYFSRRGIRVAPFKALNMSNNARVADGGEMATAQYLQALAAGVHPDVRMNPVLLKPETDTRSQVVVLGKIDRGLSRSDWRGRSALLWPRIEEAFRSLEEDFDMVLIEGAGSPAETNLAESDVANMRMAKLARAPVLVVADINRGGAFAHLYGTWALLPPDERALIRGFVLNKFRGDPSLLHPAPQDLERMTGVPMVGVVPWTRHDLPDEDGVSPATSPNDSAPTVAVVHYPTASNLDEFKALERAVRLRWVRDPAEIADADLVVLPGSKHVAADMAWLGDRGFSDRLRAHACNGGLLLGICGGLQMLGERIEDPTGVDGAARGLGLLPLLTTFEEDKLTRRTDAQFAALAAPWSDLSGLSFAGYEIRHGRTVTTGAVGEAMSKGIGYVAGNVLGIYAHGLFESADVLSSLFHRDASAPLAATFDLLATVVETHLDVPLLEALVGLHV